MWIKYPKDLSLSSAYIPVYVLMWTRHHLIKGKQFFVFHCLIGGQHHEKCRGLTESDQERWASEQTAREVLERRKHGLSFGHI